MGSAIESFDDAGAVVVPRSRFAPVKTTNDLFVLRSDAYLVRAKSPEDARVRTQAPWRQVVLASTPACNCSILVNAWCPWLEGLLYAPCLSIQALFALSSILPQPAD